MPLLKLFFVISYVLLAPFVGAFADALPKGRVMLVTNAIKIAGCAMLFWAVHPLLAYAMVGFGAAAYSPAKYGILTELLPPEKLVAANGWIEGTTVASIILGTVLGGALISPSIAGALLSFDLPMIDTGIDTPAEAAIAVIAVFYLLAACSTCGIPDTGARYPHQAGNPVRLVREFVHCYRRCGATSSARSRWRSRRCSGAPAPRCSSSCSSGPRSSSACGSIRPRCCKGSSRSASRSGRRQRPV